MEVGGEGDYIPIATLSPPEWPALRWAAMRAILIFHSLWGTKSQDSVHKPQLLKRKESRSGIEPRSFRVPAYRFTARTNRLSITCYDALFFFKLSGDSKGKRRALDRYMGGYNITRKRVSNREFSTFNYFKTKQKPSSWNCLFRLSVLLKEKENAMRT